MLKQHIQNVEVAFENIEIVHCKCSFLKQMKNFKNVHIGSYFVVELIINNMMVQTEFKRQRINGLRENYI